MSKMIEQLEEMKTLQFEHEFQNYRDEYDDELAI